MKQRLTLRDVAQAAGVSHTTVSLALRNSPRISPEVRTEVQAVASSMGYQPDPLVAKVMSSLRFQTEGTRRMAFVSRFIDNSWKKHPTIGRTYGGLLKRAAELGYEIDEFNLFEKGLSARRLSAILSTRVIRGVFVAPVMRSHSHVSLDFSELSSITFGYSVVRPALHRVANHQIHGLTLAMRKLRRLGNRRVGLVMLESTDSRSEYNWAAGLSVFNSHIPAEDRTTGLLMKKESFGEFKRWFNRARPDAIVSLSDRVPEWLAEMDLGVPEEVQLATLDRKPDEHHLAGIDQHHDIAGAVAVDLLLGQMYLNECGIPALPRTVLIEGTWVDGPSVQKR